MRRRRLNKPVALLAGVVLAGSGLGAISLLANAQLQEPAPATGQAGPCLLIANEKHVVIENRVLGPCEGAGIEIRDSQDVTLRNVAITDAQGAGIHILDSTSIRVEESRISTAASGIYALGSSGIVVSCNTFADPQGPKPRGQYVQFDKVIGGVNAITCNVGRSAAGRSTPEDGINLYESSGDQSNPILVTDNLLIGGGPSDSGGGILLGDNGGSFQQARNNVLVDPGQYGIAVAGGSYMTVADNTVFGRQQPFTNVGVYVWNQYRPECFAITVEGNSVQWANRTGQQNAYWNAGNCGPVMERKNDFSARLSETISQASIPAACKCRVNGRIRP